LDGDAFSKKGIDTAWLTGDEDDPADAPEVCFAYGIKLPMPWGGPTCTMMLGIIDDKGNQILPDGKTWNNGKDVTKLGNSKKPVDTKKIRGFACY
jgi:hypothetical protein